MSKNYSPNPLKGIERTLHLLQDPAFVADVKAANL
jgi:hypothetical protein